MIVLPVIVPLGLGAYRVSWDGDADATVRVFVNGGLAYGPTSIATEAKSVELSLPDPAIVEVHENAADDTVPAAGIALERKPLIWWSSVPGAFRYRVSVDDELVAVLLHDPSRLHHQLRLSADVRVDGGAWSSFKVEAESASGLVSPSQPVPLFVPGVTLAPESVEITGGAGTFDLEVFA